MDGGNRQGWIVQVDGKAGRPDTDRICVFRFDAPQITIEVMAPGIRSMSGDEQALLARRALIEAAVALQRALDSPAALQGLAPKP